jgi:sulfite reductase (ferredoxin)
MCTSCGCTPATGLSRIERIKETSDHLRGSIAHELTLEEPTFSEETVQILKFHGVYQQEDRDRRRQARQQHGERLHVMMVRTRIPGGQVPPEAYLAHDDIAGRWGNGTLRITTRQDFQVHGVLKANLKATIRAINQALLTTLGGCGDQERNVMFCPAPVRDPLRAEARQALAALVAELSPRTRAYHEIWLDGERVAEPEVEDLYGERYLPRKFKTAVAVEGDNCVDVYANDLALVARRGPGGGLRGFEVMVGGGLGRTNHKPDTFPRLAVSLGFVPPERVVPLARAVVAVQRDWGNRSDRRHARLKYLVLERGLGWFREQVEQEAGFRVEPSGDLHWEETEDHLGWHQQGDGRLFFGLFIENGRIADGEVRLRSALRQLVERLRCSMRLTPQQNLILADLEPDQRPLVERILAEHGVVPPERLPAALRHSMACPALPTCGLAVAEAERALPALIRQVTRMLDELGLEREPISVRMSGCPNGCPRPYLGDVGIVGTTLGKYDLWVGGDRFGTRLNRLLAANVPLAEIPSRLRPLLEAFARGRAAGEGFGDWCHRQGAALDRLAEPAGVGQ